LSKIGYGYGSEWHLLRYLGYHREELNKCILKVTTGNTIDWLDSEFSFVCKSLSDDNEWTGIKAIADPIVTSCWRQYWPASGSPPNWDAVARLNKDEQQEWMLVEAKAHVGEMNSRCGATSIKSKQMIRAALEATAKEVTNSGVPTEAWDKEFYQYANRLAVLNFLMLNACSSITPTRLIFIYFCGERVSKMKGCNCPRSQTDWQPHIDAMYKKLDINPNAPLMQKVHHIFIPINPQC
jgi:hypothetical protein